MRYRTYISLATAGLIILLIALLRPSVKYSEAANQLQAERFWIMKAQNKGKYNMLLLGDSRTYRGLSPTELSKCLPEYNSYNFAFSSGGLKPEMYHAAEGILDKANPHKIIVLGVTVSSLLGEQENNPQYRAEHNRPQSAYLERVYINYHLENFLPFDHDLLLHALTGKKENHPLYISNYNHDGWVASNKIPEDTTEQLLSSTQELEHYKAKPELIKALVEQTRQWTAKGIMVVGYRPPTTLAMQQMEDSLGQMDFKQFAKDFEAAGGKWIDVDRAQYHSYDGSHLDEESAIKLSRYIGNKIMKAQK